MIRTNLTRARLVRRRRRGRNALAALALAAVLTAVLAAAASASTVCVNAGAACPSGATRTSSLQGALDAALANPGPDQILLGDKGSDYQGQFRYLPSRLATDNTVTIRGVGSRRPALSGLDAFQGIFASLDGVDVHMPSVDDGDGLAITDGALSRVTVSGGDDPMGRVGGGTGIETTGRVTMDDVQVLNGVAKSVLAHGSLTARRLTTRNSGRGIQWAPLKALSETQTTVDIADSRLGGEDEAVASEGSAVTIRDSVLAARRSDIPTFGVRQLNHSSVVPANLTLDHVTIAHSGPAADGSAAISLSTDTGQPTANVHAVALAGFPRGIERSTSNGSTFPLSITESAWDGSIDALGGAAGGPFTESGNSHQAPSFVDLAGGDLRLRGGSSAIDRDATSPVTRYTDIDGAPAVDGDGDRLIRPDAGAIEYRHQPPKIDSATVPGSGVAGTPLSFGATTTDADGDQVTLAWAFGDGAKTTGASASHTYAAAGTYTATLVATDDAGLTDTRTFSVTVAPAPASAGGGSTTTGTATGTPDRTAPSLTGVRVRPTPVKLAKARRLRLRFSVSETATMRIVARRKIGTRFVTARGAITRRVVAGSGSLALDRVLQKLGVLHPGTISLTVTAKDAAGNRSARSIARFRIVR